MNIITFYKVANFFLRINIPLLPKIIYYIQFLLFNSILPASTKIGKGTIVAYGGISIVIHKKAVIGDNCIIGQGITIGGKSKQKNVPVIGNEVYIGAGSRVIGDISIGNNVLIGPNAVVTKDVPDGSIVVGVPAKIIRSNIIMRDYI